jgi:hypothetical protein
MSESKGKMTAMMSVSANAGNVSEHTSIFRGNTLGTGQGFPH